MTDRLRPDEFVFSSARGRAELNPYVDKIQEYAPWAMTTELAEGKQGQWRTMMGLPEDAPLILEIGPGNGFFFRELAKRWPQAGLVAIEVRFKRVWLTARKSRQRGLEQFRVIHHHSDHLDLLFGPGELDAVYANHPDPWPKDRHHKHRLLKDSFAKSLMHHIRPMGEFWLKSDFDAYGPLVREVFSEPDFAEIAYTNDLHGSGRELLEKPPEAAHFWAGDLSTNYERKSRKKGARIVVGGYRRVG